MLASVVVMVPRLVLTVISVPWATGLPSASLMTPDVMVDVLLPSAGIAVGEAEREIVPTGTPGVIVMVPVASSVAVA